MKGWEIDCDQTISCWLEEAYFVATAVAVAAFLQHGQNEYADAFLSSYSLFVLRQQIKCDWFKKELPCREMQGVSFLQTAHQQKISFLYCLGKSRKRRGNHNVFFKLTAVTVEWLKEQKMPGYCWLHKLALHEVLGWLKKDISNYADNFLWPYPVLNYFEYPRMCRKQLKLSSAILHIAECDSAARTVFLAQKSLWIDLNRENF